MTGQMVRRRNEEIINTVPYECYKKQKPFKTLAVPKELKQFIGDRVEKLKELYEQCKPVVESRWVLPPGVTDGRKAVKIEVIIGEDVSPFDLPDFKEQMPNIEDYAVEEESDELSRRTGQGLPLA